MKVCRDCLIEKPLSCFYKHSAMKDGYLNKCSDCVKARVSKHRDLNLERIREYDRQRSMLPHRVAARVDYLKTESGAIARKKALDKYKKVRPMAYAAHIITQNYVRDGKLTPASECSVCGSTYKIEGHHDDYTKPLDIRWLCNPCHRKWHKEHTPIYE